MSLFNYKDLGYDDWKDPLELCLLTFIPSEEPIDPKILAYDYLGNKKIPKELILYDRKLYQNNED